MERCESIFGGHIAISPVLQLIPDCADLHKHNFRILDSRPKLQPNKTVLSQCEWDFINHKGQDHYKWSQLYFQRAQS